MRDPHVIALLYHLKHSDRVKFNDPPLLDVVGPGFDIHLEDGKLRVTLHDHYSTAEAAREVVYPFLRSWELQFALEAGHRDIWFEFDRAELIDRNPLAEGESFVAQASGGSYVTIGCKGRLTAGRNSYPPPDPDFVAGPGVTTMWIRYEQYLNGHESLPSMANACMTLLEGTTGLTTGFRDAVCKKYSIERALRKKLGDLISEKGDVYEARKLGTSASLTPFSAEERLWIEEVVRRLIRRRGEYDANPTGTFPEIKMSDFRKL